jgi:hypothetical protein
MTKTSSPDDGLIAVAFILIIVGAVLATSLYGIFPWAFVSSLLTSDYAGTHQFWGNDVLGNFCARVSNAIILLLYENFSLSVTRSWMLPLVPAILCWVPAAWMITKWVRDTVRGAAEYSEARISDSRRVL